MIEVGTREIPATVAGAPPLVEVTFSIPDRPDIAVAAVVGDFNEWTATEMTRTATGYSVTLWLERGRRHRFKYLLNGAQWENDWAADDYEPNQHGGDDSVVDLCQPDRSPDGERPAKRTRRRDRKPARELAEGAQQRTLVVGDAPATPLRVYAATPAFDRDRRAIAEFLQACREARFRAAGAESGSRQPLTGASAVASTAPA